MSQPIEVLLFGLGAVGSVYAYILTQAPNTRVTVCARSNYDVVKSSGLRLESEKFGLKESVKFHRVVKTPSDPELQGVRFDYIVCTNKAITTSPTASEIIHPIVGDNTTIALIQNGVGNDREFRERFPGSTILSGVTWVNANQPSTGVVIHRHDETMQFGVHYTEHPELTKEIQTQRMDEFVSLLRAGGTNVEVVPDIGVWRWKKTIWNCTWNTLTALTLANTAQFLNASSSAPTVAKSLIAELATVARADGYQIEQDYLDSLIDRSSVWQGIFSSMGVDAVHERPMEVDVIVTKPLEAAQRLGIHTPILLTIHALVSTIDWRVRNRVGKGVVG